jgi:hypothetical protein
MRVLAFLYCIALAGAVALPAAQVDKPGHLTNGDLELDLKTGCLNFPKKANSVSTLANLYTKLQVNAGYTCELYG